MIIIEDENIYLEDSIKDIEEIISQNLTEKELNNTLDLSNSTIKGEEFMELKSLYFISENQNIDKKSVLNKRLYSKLETALEQKNRISEVIGRAYVLRCDIEDIEIDTSRCLDLINSKNIENIKRYYSKEIKENRAKEGDNKVIIRYCKDNKYQLLRSLDIGKKVEFNGVVFRENIHYYYKLIDTDYIKSIERINNNI